MAPLHKSPLNLVLGTSSIGDKSIDSMARFDSPDEVNGFLDVFVKRGYNQLDSSRMYSPHAPTTSEPRVGLANEGAKFVIDTKVMSAEPGSHTKEKILSEIDASLKALKVKQIHIEYLHVPDRATPFEEACEAMNQAVDQGKIKYWGLSNYTAEEVQTFVDICEQRGLVKPSVYQGQYNPIVRASEKALFPILRKNKISFYAYSPAAGGFFAGNHKNANAGGRFDKSLPAGNVYANTYMKESVMAAADKAVAVALKHGISGHAAALRWTIYHSLLSSAHGDSVIIGASSPEQLESNFEKIEQGPLPDDVLSAMEAVYEELGDEVPYHL